MHRLLCVVCGVLVVVVVAVRVGLVLLVCLAVLVDYVLCKQPPLQSETEGSDRREDSENM